MINSALEYQNCNMISPWYRYTDDNEGFRRKRIDRKEENSTKLEEIISQNMKKNYQKNIAENLEDKTPVLYIDCSQKWDLDIMFFLLKEYERISAAKDTTEIIAKTIETRSIIIEPEQRKAYIKAQQPTSEEMITHYQNLLHKRLTELKPDHANYVLNCENDLAIVWLAALMEKENKKYMYLYLDNTSNLSVEEQTRINLLLYARWWINDNKWLHLKINNWAKSRKTRTASNGIRVEAIHDYSETNIYEEDIDETI